MTFPVDPAVAVPQDVSIVLRSRRAGFREIELVVNHWARSWRDPAAATEMLVYGDIDPNCNPRIQATSAESGWLPFDASMELVLAAGTGPKYLNVKVRGPGGETEVMQAVGEVGTTPHTSLLWAAVAPLRPTVMGFSPSHAASAYRIAMCTNEDDEFDDNEPFASGGALSAGQYVEVMLPSHDSAHVIVKMFIQVSGIWYA